MGGMLLTYAVRCVPVQVNWHCPAGSIKKDTDARHDIWGFHVGDAATKFCRARQDAAKFFDARVTNVKTPNLKLLCHVSLALSANSGKFGCLWHWSGNLGTARQKIKAVLNLTNESQPPYIFDSRRIQCEAGEAVSQTSALCHRYINDSLASVCVRECVST